MIPKVLNRSGPSRRMRLSQLAALSAVILFGIAMMRHRAPLVAQGAAPVFTKDVAPIFDASCTTCHRSGGLGPFSLVEYDSAKENAAEIRHAVETGYMPPWHAEGPHDRFLNDRRLSEADKQTILRWIDAGAQKGDDADLPARPVYASEWTIGTPDAVVEMATEFTIPAKGTVEYQYFEVPTNFTEDHWVNAIEIMPGAREVVHHVIVYARAPAPNRSAVTAAPAAAATPAPPATPARLPLFLDKPEYETPPETPRADTRFPPPRRLGPSIGGTVPGGNVIALPEGTALRVRAGTILTVQMHYTASGHEMHDRTRVGFKFAESAPAKEMRIGAFINGTFTLPAGERDVAVRSELEPTEAVTIYSLLPHTHLRGTGWKYELEMPDGSSEVVLDVPRYDFNWQTTYVFATPLVVPAGAKLKSTAWYDNSSANVHNPDASVDVKWGEQTWEEMQFTSFLYTVNGTGK